MDGNLALEPLPNAASSGADYLAIFVLLFFAIHTAAVGFTFVLHYFDAAGRSDAVFPAGAYLRNFAREWWWCIAMVLLYPFGLLPRLGSFRYDRRGGPPIFLVHGFLMNRSCMFALYWRMRRLGYRNLYPVNLVPAFGAIESSGARLAGQIREVSQLAGGQPVTAVVHSMGGLVLRWCAQEYPDLPLAKIISIATPHHGSRAAALSAANNARQMRPGSSFLASLPATTRVPLVSLYSRLDNIVIPSSSSDFGDHRLEMSAYSHMSLLFEGRPFEWVAAELPALGAGNEYPNDAARHSS